MDGFDPTLDLETSWPYQYTRLPNGRNVRLLQLYSEASSGGNLVGELVLRDLNEDGVDYEAVSWCWGEESWTGVIHIFVDQAYQKLHIPPNLEQALRALRLPNKRRALWADAVCIDQTCVDEKNHQLPLMASIYSTAAQVCVWLGEGLALPASATEAITTLASRPDLKTFSMTAEDWQSLLRLAENQWFTRRWVLQEIALAKDATVYCGVSSVSWNIISEALLFGATLVWDSRPSIAGTYGVRFVRVFRDLFSDNRQNSSRRRVIPLKDLLPPLSDLRVTDPKDCIYALLAVAKGVEPTAYNRIGTHGQYMYNSSGEPEREAKESKPSRGGHEASSRRAMQKYHINSSITFDQACRDYVAFTIANHRASDLDQALNVLFRRWMPVCYLDPTSGLWECGRSAHKCNDHYTSMPSWMRHMKGSPWSRNKSGTERQRRNADPLVESEYHKFRASGSCRLVIEDLRWNEVQAKTTLTAKGFFLESIEQVREPCREGSIPRSWFSPWDDSRTQSALGRTIAYMLLAGSAYGESGDLSYVLSSIFNSLINHNNDPEYIHTRPDSADFDMVWSQERQQPYAIIVQARTWNKRLARTSSNRLCLVDQDVKEGDMVCILYGCSVPVILRPHQDDGGGSWYELLGECYLHGMMDGEAIKWRAKNKIGDQIFEIR